MEEKLADEIERIQNQTETDKKKLESIITKSRAKLQEISENQKKLLDKEQKILEVRSADPNHKLSRKEVQRHASGKQGKTQNRSD